MRTAKYYLGIFIAVIFNTAVHAQPTVFDLGAPVGPIGSTVGIAGTGFSTIPGTNFVRFGYAQANVISATTNQLLVKVPRGATTLPVSVTVNQLTGVSTFPFIVQPVFCSNTTLAYDSFDSSKSFSAGSGNWNIAAGDLDWDGKTDLVYGNYGTDSTMSIHRNTSTAGNISMAPKIDIPVGLYPDDQVIADFDGDRIPDIIVATPGNANYDLAVFRNLSSPGNINFAARKEINTTVGADKLVVADLDKDGKLDLIISYAANNDLCVLRNISTTGNIAFAPVVHFPVAVFAGYASVGDIDSDGKMDVIVSNYFDPQISVLRNTSTTGSISFAAAVNIPAPGNNMHGNTVVDLNRDGKPDIVAVYIGSTFISVIKNTSTPGNISFAPVTTVSIAPSRSYNISFTDFDGDLNLDLVFSTNYGPGYGIGVLKNTSNGVNISFGTIQKYKLDVSPYISIVADMDNDGKPDLIGGMGSATAPTISILRNRMCETVSSCQGGNIYITSNIGGSTYRWQLDSGSGFNDLANGGIYSGVTTAQLHLVNIPVSAVNYKFRCLVEDIPTSISVLKFGNTWLGMVSSVWEDPVNWSCGSIPDMYTDVVIPSGSFVQVNLNTTINSITVNPTAAVTIAPGVNLVVLH